MRLVVVVDDAARDAIARLYLDLRRRVTEALGGGLDIALLEAAAQVDDRDAGMVRVDALTDRAGVVGGRDLQRCEDRLRCRAARDARARWARPLVQRPRYRLGAARCVRGARTGRAGPAVDVGPVHRGARPHVGQLVELGDFRQLVEVEGCVRGRLDDLQGARRGTCSIGPRFPPLARRCGSGRRTPSSPSFLRP